MLDKDDAKRLVQALQANRVVLFLGAGASLDAVARNGESFPHGRRLCEELWDYLEYSGPFDNTDLQTLFEAALKHKKGHVALDAFLKERLLSSSVPDWYNALAHYFWYRIYGTNVDDIVETVYARQSRKLDVAVGGADDYSERNQLLASVQYVKLNGCLVRGTAKDVTFSTRQFARRTTDHDVWYDHFVRDYATHPSVLVGTELNEPIFWQYVAAREKKGQDTKQNRPGSFLVCPKISPAKVDALRDMGIVPVEATGKDFFEWLATVASPPHERRAVLEAVDPLLSKQLFSPVVQGASGPRRRDFEEFYRAFRLVEDGARPDQSHRRKMFLLGAAPRWQDFVHDLDAVREINATAKDLVLTLVHENETLDLVPITGSAGSGKSTLLMRTALSVQSAGVPCYYTSGEWLPKDHVIANVIDSLGQRVVLWVDDADNLLGELSPLLRKLATCDIPPVVVLSARTNRYDRYAGPLESESTASEISIPNLTEPDIENLLGVLEKNNALGELRGLAPAQRHQRFADQADRQILVAMREATLGGGFNEIIKNEFAQLEDDEAQSLYLCAGLTTASGFGITEGQLIACAEVEPNRAMEIVGRALKNIVIPDASGQYRLRHRVIAEFMVDVEFPRFLGQVQ